MRLDEISEECQELGGEKERKRGGREGERGSECVKESQRKRSSFFFFNESIIC